MLKVLPAVFISILSTRAWAADTSTYRPGSVYYSAAVDTSELCAAQCTGDAQCRSWNYVRLNSAQKAGVCELNTNEAAPVASPLSISGVNGGARTSPNIISAGTNTIRVGNPQAAITPAPPQLRRPQVQANTQLASRQALQRPNNVQSRAAQPQSRQIIKRPVPVQIQSQRAAYKSQPPRIALPQANQTQMRAHPNLRATPAAIMQKPPAVMAEVEAPRAIFTPYLDDGVRPQPAAPSQVAAQPEIRAAASLGAVTGGTSVPTLASPTAPPPIVQAMPSPNLDLAGVTGSALNVAPAPLNLQTRPSLFGSLYDDLNEGAASPKVLSSDDIPDDPDAPIATVSAVPTTPISIEPF